ncbi:DUF6042 family protein [Sorangium sp. So ce448]|uniref:DUF6042 family protein n=1 Tax=Sorangium sp. So ce448 TaxID=3133314 RepID=UPI003F63C4A5
MSDKYKRRVRALAAKLNISYQAADNMLKAGGRRNGSQAAAISANSDAAGLVTLENEAESSPPSDGPPSVRYATHEEQEDLVARTRELLRYARPSVAAVVAGWIALVATPTLHSLLHAVESGVTTEGIERELTREFRRKRPMTLRQSRLPRSSAATVETLATIARFVGHDPPTTFGDLLLLLRRLGVVTEHAGQYAVAFPPPAPEETLPLTSKQRSDVLRCRQGWEPGMAGTDMLKACISAEAPGFVPPSWMRAVLDQPYSPEDCTPSYAYVPPRTCFVIEGYDVDPALCDQIGRLFSTYLTESPRACPCSAAVSKFSRYATSNAGIMLLEAWCTQGHFGYMGRRVADFCPLNSASEACVERFLQGRPDGESIQARDFYTEYVLWSLSQKSRPATNVMFSYRVMASGLYARTNRRPGGRTYHRLPFESVS